MKIHDEFVERSVASIQDLDEFVEKSEVNCYGEKLRQMKGVEKVSAIIKKSNINLKSEKNSTLASTRK